MTPDALRQELDRLPRGRVACLPTPLHPLKGLSAALNRDIWMKREDLTGLALGGNKVRELEYILGYALSEGADVLIAGGGVAQSNHARQCAAAATALGMDVELVLRRGLRANDLQGNLLITSMFRPTIHWIDTDPQLEDRNEVEPTMRTVESRLRTEGKTPYTLVSSFHPLAAVSYVGFVVELLQQLTELKREHSNWELFVTSMGATHVGILLGVALLSLPWNVTAVSWKPKPKDLGERLLHLADQTVDTLGLENPLSAEDFTTLDFGGPAYGIPSERGWEAIRLCASSDGLLLDPVYTGKGMAGLLNRIQGGEVPENRPVLFVHTGGVPSLFAYAGDVAAEFGVAR